MRSLIRRVILARPTPDTVEVKVVWVSGAFSTLSVHPVIHRATDVSGYEQLVKRLVMHGVVFRRGTNDNLLQLFVRQLRQADVGQGDRQDQAADP